MNYANFYEIATYVNEINRNIFNARELAENTHIYYADFQWSKENGIIAHNIKELAKILAEDGSEECKDWLYEIAKELKLTDMDFMDYMETDTDIVSMFLAEPSVTESEIKISGIISKNGEDDYELYNGFVLSKEDEKAIWKILQKYETEGGSERGTQREVAKYFYSETVKELSESYGVIDLLTAAIMRNNNLSYEEAEDIAMRLNSSDYLFDRMIDDFMDEE